MPSIRPIRQNYPKSETWRPHALQNGAPVVEPAPLPDSLMRQFDIGKHIYWLGQLTNDIDCFKSALAVYGDALALAQTLHLNPSVQTEICMGMAKAALALQDETAIEDAVMYLKTLLAEGKAAQHVISPDAEFMLGMLLAKQRNYASAIRVLDIWWATHLRHEHSAWVRQYALWLGTQAHSQSIGNGHDSHSDDLILQAYEFSQRQTWPEWGLPHLVQHYQKIKTALAATFPAYHLAFGRAFIEKHAYVEAIAALKQAVNEFAPNKRAPALFDLAYTHLVYGQYAEATHAMRQYTEIASMEDRFSVAPLTALLDRLSQSRRHALLVGINQYHHKDLPRLRGAKNDVAAMRDVLIQRWGFQAEDITELMDDQATRDAILTKFKLLTAISRERPCVFYFAGHGATDQDSLPTIIPVDGRCGDVREISLDELAKFAGDTSANLVTIFDVGFESDHAKYASGRSVKQAIKPRLQPRFGSREAWHNHAAALTVGAMSVYAHPPEDHAHARTLEIKIQGNDPLNIATTYRGRLTTMLVDILDQAGMSLTLSQLREALNEAYQDELLPSARTTPTHSDQRPVFLSTVHNQAVTMADEIRQSPLRQIAATLRNAIKLPDDILRSDDGAAFDPNGLRWHVRLNLGIVCAAYGDYAEALAWLSELSNTKVLPKPDNDFQVHYHLGRVLFLAGNDAKLEQAASELRRASEISPGDVRAHYFLAQTLRAQIERLYLKQIESLLKTYTQHGAPLGVA